MDLDLKSKEFGVKDLIVNSFKFFIDNFMLILMISLIIYIPLNILRIFLAPIIAAMFFPPLNVLVLLVVGIIGIVVSTIGTLAVIYAVNCVINKKTVTAVEAIKFGVEIFPAALKTIVHLLISLIKKIILIAPFFTHLIYWYFAVYSVVIDGKADESALVHSKSIVDGRLKKVFITILLLVVFFMILMTLVNAPLAGAGFVMNFISGLIYDIVGSIFAIALTLYYLNLNACAVSEG